jgi:hypothetical protein
MTHGKGKKGTTSGCPLLNVVNPFRAELHLPPITDEDVNKCVNVDEPTSENIASRVESVVGQVGKHDLAIGVLATRIDKLADELTSLKKLVTNKAGTSAPAGQGSKPAAPVEAAPATTKAEKAREKRKKRRALKAAAEK